VDGRRRHLRVALIWGGDIIFERTLMDPEPVTIGESDAAMFQVACGGLDVHTLLTPEQHGWWLYAPEGTKGRVAFDEREFELQQGARVFLEGADRGAIDLGNGVTMAFSFVWLPRRLFAAGWQTDPRIIASWVLSATLILGVLMLALLSPRPKRLMQLDEQLAMVHPEYIPMDLREQQEPDEPDVPPEPFRADEDLTGKRSGGEEGKPGDPEERIDKETKIPKNIDELVEKIDVRKLGVAEALEQALANPTSALGTVLAGDRTVIESKMVAAGSDPGAELQIGHGPGGMGFRGTGTGGGDPEGGPGRLRGLGKVDTGGGVGRIGIVGRRKPRKRRRVPPIKTGGVKASGYCSRGSLVRAVKRRSAAFRACYEMELLSRPNLRGRIETRWTINMQGRVVGAKITRNSMGHAKVADCVLRTIRRVRFEKPEGGMCVVAWPFMFQPGG